MSLLPAYPGAFYPGTTYPSFTGGFGADRTPSKNVRVECAFSTNPDDAVPAWVDLTTRVNLPAGISITRGRQSEFDTVQAGTLGVTLENIDGALSPDNTGSPYYPNVLPQRRIRVTYRDPGNLGQGNMLAAEDASFEGGTIGAWGNNYIGAPAAVTLSNSVTHPSTGTKGMLIGWPTAAAGCAAVLSTPPLVIGRRYTFRVVIWNAVGTPAVNFGDIFGVISAGALSTTTGAFETLTFSWVATATQPVFGIKSNAATTTGQQTWVDAFMIDETPVGTSLGTFTTIAPIINPRFDGYVNEWPIEWPDGGDTYSRATISASDLLARLDARQKLRSVVVETMALDNPVIDFPLGEAQGSTQVADVASAQPTVLSIQQYGVGGTIGFGAGTGARTDGLSAPIFTPASLTQGKVLAGPVPVIGTAGYSGGITLVATAATTSPLDNVAACLSNNAGGRLMVGYDAAPGEPYAIYQDGLGNSAVALGASGQNDGQTRHIAAVLVGNGVSQITLSLYVNGVFVTSQTSGANQIAIQSMSRLTIGGDDRGQCYNGTISHVAAFASALPAGHLLDHRTAQTTGFAGERSDQRIARICTWVGLPTARQALDVGNSTSVGHFDCTGSSPLEYLRKVELTEAGLLFAGADGRLTFYNRARSYATTSPSLSIPVDMLEPTARLVKNLQLVKNEITGSRVGGATVRMVDSASQAAYGLLTEQIDVLATTDDVVVDAVGWRLNTSKNPLTRFTSLDLDAYSDGTYSPQILAGIDLGARVQITGMPAQAPSSTLKQTVQGYTETITEKDWLLSVNATPYDHMTGLVLDNATYGTTDSTNHLAY